MIDKLKLARSIARRLPERGQIDISNWHLEAFDEAFNEGHALEAFKRLVLAGIAETLQLVLLEEALVCLAVEDDGSLVEPLSIEMTIPLDDGNDDGPLFIGRIDDLWFTQVFGFTDPIDRRNTELIRDFARDLLDKAETTLAGREVEV